VGEDDSEHALDRQHSEGRSQERATQDQTREHARLVEHVIEGDEPAHAVGQHHARPCESADDAIDVVSEVGELGDVTARPLRAAVASEVEEMGRVPRRRQRGDDVPVAAPVLAEPVDDKEISPGLGDGMVLSDERQPVVREDA